MALGYIEIGSHHFSQQRRGISACHLVGHGEQVEVIALRSNQVALSAALLQLSNGFDDRSFPGVGSDE